MESSRKKQRALRIGKYEVQRHIATGGMGAVYYAIDTELNRPVALKILSPDLATRPNMLERFRREARSAAKLRHENIVAIYECGNASDTHFLALEFVDGVDLHEHIRSEGQLNPAAALRIVQQAAKALQHAHSKGIVHRDIKPSNFLLTEKNGKPFIKLTDLGLARQQNDDEFRVTKAGTTVGTVDYMAPEQARNSAAADIRSDIYSLGCTFYHMLTGNSPFPDGSLPERIYKHAEVDAPDVRELNSEVSSGLATIVRKMLAKNPGDRYQTPTELLQDLIDPSKLDRTEDKSVHLANLEKLANAEKRVRRPMKERPSSTAIDASAPTSTLPASKKTRRRRGQKPKPPKNHRLPWPIVIGGSILMLIVITVIMVLQSRNGEPISQNKQTPQNNRTKKSITPITPKKNPVFVPPIVKKSIPVVGPEMPFNPQMFKPSVLIDFAEKRKTYYGVLDNFPAPSNQAVVFEVSRITIPGPTRFRSLADALKHAPTGKQTVIEIHDNGPIFEGALPKISNRDVFVRGAAGFRPLIAWDVSTIPMGKRQIFEFQSGRLILEDVDVVFGSSNEELSEQAITIVELKKSGFWAKNCIFSVAGQNEKGVKLVSFANFQPADNAPIEGRISTANQCRLSNCYIRGSSFTTVAVDLCPADILLDNCLVVGGEQPFADIAEISSKAPVLRIVRSTIVGSATFLQVVGDSLGTTSTKCLSWDTLLACSNPQAKSALVRFVKVKHDFMQWKPFNCVYAGWQKLLDSDQDSITGDNISKWRVLRIYGNLDASVPASWPAYHPMEPESIAAHTYDVHGTKACYVASIDNGPLGCQLGKLAADRTDWLARTFDEIAVDAPFLPETTVPAIPFKNDGYYHGETINLNDPQKKDLGKYLHYQLTMRKPAQRVVIHVHGHGEKTTSPLRIAGVAEFVLFFAPPPKGKEALTLVPNSDSSGDKAGLFAIEGGTLEVVGARIRLPNSKFEPIPARAFYVVDGRLRLCRCFLEGPILKAPPAYRGLIGMQQDPDHLDPIRFSFRDSVFVSGENIIQIKGTGCRGRIKNCVLAGADAGLVGWLNGRPDIQLLLENNTVAIRGSFIQIGQVPNYCDFPIVVQAKRNLFLNPFAKAELASLVYLDKAAIEKGAVLWRGSENAFDQKHFTHLLKTVQGGTASTVLDWQKIWGVNGENDALLDFDTKSTGTINLNDYFGKPFPIQLLDMRSANGGIECGADFGRLRIFKKKKSS